MLKKYATPGSLRLVGKAWEIRFALRREQQRQAGGTSLAATLPPPSKLPVDDRSR